LNIALYGFMGVGKTTVGKLLAKQLGYGFVDMDVEIEKNTGMAISEIFRLNGESRFRELESKLVDELSSKNDLVIACGGGVVADADNADKLRTSSRMVYLTATVEAIIRRTSVDKSRPLLNVTDPVETATRLLEERDPVYKKYAEITVNTTDIAPEKVVSAILEALA
jgi:shikimate kinase